MYILNKKRLTIALISLSAMIVLIAAVLAIKSGKILKINISLVDKNADYSESASSLSREDLSESKAETVTEFDHSEIASSRDAEIPSGDNSITTIINSVISTTLKTISSSKQKQEPITNTENTSKATTLKPSTTKAAIINGNSSGEIKSRIRVFDVLVSDIDSVGGVSPGIYWRNESNKTIKYIYFDFKPYNAVGDPVSCTIRGYSTHTCYITGPIEKTELGQYILWPIYDYQGQPMGYDGWEYVETWDFDKSDYGEPNVFNKGIEKKKEEGRLHYLTEEEIKRTARFDDWDCIWYNGEIETIKIINIKIEYMDGEVFNIGQSQVQQVFW